MQSRETVCFTLLSIQKSKNKRDKYSIFKITFFSVSVNYFQEILVSDYVSFIESHKMKPSGSIVLNRSKVEQNWTENTSEIPKALLKWIAKEIPENTQDGSFCQQLLKEKLYETNETWMNN